MIIIGIAGGIGHGKTSFAEALQKAEPSSIHLETSALIAEVIDAWQSQTKTLPQPNNVQLINKWLELLPQALEQVTHSKIEPTALHLDASDIAAHPELYEKLFVYVQALQQNPRLIKTRVTPTNKIEYRSLLQWLGGYVQLKLPPGIWFHELMSRAKASGAKGAQLCIMSGVRFPADVNVIHQGDGYIVLVDRPLVAEVDASDPTERERNQLDADAVIVNDAGLDELALCARQLYEDVRRGKLKNQYTAADMRS